MSEILLSPNQFMAIKNITYNQLVPFSMISEYIELWNTLSKVDDEDLADQIKLNLNDHDTQILLAMVQEGRIIVKEIPFILGLIRSINPLDKTIDK